MSLYSCLYKVLPKTIISGGGGGGGVVSDYEFSGAGYKEWTVFRFIYL